MRYMAKFVEQLRQDRSGITGLETAIVLIAFVVVSSVFAFAALSTGLFSSDKSKEAINAGLKEASGTLEIRGSIVANAIDTTGTADGTTPTAVDSLMLQVANAAGGAAVDLTPGETVITYLDANQAVPLASGDFTVTALGLADADYLVEPGEMYEIKIQNLVSKLTTDLGSDQLFSFQVKPPLGAVVHIQRRTPVSMDAFNDLN